MTYEEKLLDYLRKHTQHMNNNILTFHADWQRIEKLIKVQIKDFYPIKTNNEFDKHYKNAKNKLFKERLGDFVGGVFTNAYKPIQNYYSKNELDALSE